MIESEGLLQRARQIGEVALPRLEGLVDAERTGGPR